MRIRRCKKNEDRLEHNLGKLQGDYLLARAVSIVFSFINIVLLGLVWFGLVWFDFTPILFHSISIMSSSFFELS
jgi:hypothetical protein